MRGNPVVPQPGAAQVASHQWLVDLGGQTWFARQPVRTWCPAGPYRVFHILEGLQ